MWVSVVIPTFQRSQSLKRLLQTLSGQTLPRHQFEVIVVDDGSNDETVEVVDLDLPFELIYLAQENEGATKARNRGATRARGETIVFIDDDVTVSPPALAALAEACRGRKRICLGALTPRCEVDAPFPRDAVALSREDPAGDEGGDRFLHFRDCNTQLLAVNRTHFFRLGMLKDPTGGWPNWDDVDFGYRAHQAGFELLRVAAARGGHWDHSLESLQRACDRWQRAAASAARLFHVHPGIKDELPMFRDKVPIRWDRDAWPLVGRKIARRVSALPPFLAGMERTVEWLEGHRPDSAMLRPLYRWIQGAYLYRGYRQGVEHALF